MQEQELTDSHALHFSRWLQSAQPGETITYHFGQCGSLAKARDPSSALFDHAVKHVADAAWAAQINGIAYLTQRRVQPSKVYWPIYEFRATRTSRGLGK